MISEDLRRGIHADLLKKGYYIYPQFLQQQQCEQILLSIEQFKQNYTLPEIHRDTPGRKLRYFVIDGEQITQYLPAILQLYQDVNIFLNDASGQTLVPLADKKAAVNVNITPKDGQYRWHYDRNAVTVLLYLNIVRGGELEFYPKYRFYLRNKSYTRLQRWLDSVLNISIIRNLFSKKIVVTPSQGLFIVMQGSKCLHSVRPVEGDDYRINIVMSYDTNTAQFAIDKNLDAYLYTQDVTISDPNYL